MWPYRCSGWVTLHFCSFQIPLILLVNFNFCFHIASDGSTIIIYGGANAVFFGSIDTTNALWTLDTRSYVWSQPVTRNDELAPSVVPAYHTANLYGNQMILMFGALNGKPTSNVYILD